MDPKALVRRGYDRVAEAYLRSTAVTRRAEREKDMRLVTDRLPPGASVLDLGCRAGVPTTRALAGRFVVTGVDFSAAQIRRARRSVPAARFLLSDITSLALPPASCDAVVAFCSIIHVPRAQQGRLIASVHGWLHPGGLFVATPGAADMPAAVVDDWLGAPMYWSSFDAETNTQMLGEGGFRVEAATLETAEEDGEPVTFLWVVGRTASGG